MATPLVSIILPVYNVALYLERCLDSLLEQTCQDYEVIAVNDGSTDDSPAILQRYLARMPALRIIHQQNSGLGAARNAGLTQARGKYIYFVDSDDYLAKKCLQTCITRLEKERLDVLFFATHIHSAITDEPLPDYVTAYYQRPRQVINRVLSAEDFFIKSIAARTETGQGYSVVVWGYMFCAQTYRHLRFETSKYEDEYFTTELLLGKRDARVSCLADRLYHHILRAHSITTSTSHPQRVVMVLETLRLLLPRSGELTRPAAIRALSDYFDILLADAVLRHLPLMKTVFPAEKMIKYLHSTQQDLYLNSPTENGLKLLLRLIMTLAHWSGSKDVPEVKAIAENVAQAIESKKNVLAMLG